MVSGIDSAVTDVELEVIELETGSVSERAVGRSLKSIIWRYFKKLPEEDARLKCTLCRHVFRDCAAIPPIYSR